MLCGGPDNVTLYFENGTTAAAINDVMSRVPRRIFGCVSRVPPAVKAAASASALPQSWHLPHGHFSRHRLDAGRLREGLVSPLTDVNNMFTSWSMIRSFSDDETERFFADGKARWLPRDILRRAAMRLRQLDAATQIEDLRLPPSNRLELLKGDRAGQHSIRINDQWRVCFRFIDGDAFDVEIVDYH
jgi:proteic killer suppression protein